MVYRAPPSKAPLFTPPRTARAVHCWSCGVDHPLIFTLMADNKTKAPVNGEVFVCTCNAISIFDSTSHDGARKPSPSELDAITRSPRRQGSH